MTGPAPETLSFARLSSGVYESRDGRVALYRLEGVYPPAWNVEWTIDFQNELAALDPDYAPHALAYETIVDGAGSYRDAKALAAEAWPTFLARLRTIEAETAAELRAKAERLEANGFYYAAADALEDARDLEARL